MPDYRYTLSYKDAYRGYTSRSFHITAADIAAARIIADSVLAASNNLTDIAIVKEELTSVGILANVPLSTGSIGRGASFQFDLGGGKHATINTPSPIMAVVLEDRSIDLSHASVAAWLAPYLAQDVLVSDGELVLGIIGGVLDK